MRSSFCATMPNWWYSRILNSATNAPQSYWFLINFWEISQMEYQWKWLWRDMEWNVDCCIELKKTDKRIERNSSRYWWRVECWIYSCAITWYVILLQEFHSLISILHLRRLSTLFYMVFLPHIRKTEWLKMLCGNIPSPTKEVWSFGIKSQLENSLLCNILHVTLYTMSFSFYIAIEGASWSPVRTPNHIACPYPVNIESLNSPVGLESILILP